MTNNNRDTIKRSREQLYGKKYGKTSKEMKWDKVPQTTQQEKKLYHCKFNCPSTKCKTGKWDCLSCDDWISEKYLDIENY